MKLTAGQIAGHAKAAGWSGNDVAIAVAVALAESGGRSDARGDIALQTGTWGPSVGLWQIRSLKSETGTGGTRDESANMDPGTNAKHAYQIWRSQGWSRGWTTYRTGAYRLYMTAARTGAANPVGTASTTDGVTSVVGLPDIPGPIDDVIRAFTNADDVVDVLKGMAVFPIKVFDWVSERRNWTRVGWVFLGGALVVVGVVKISVDQGMAVVDKASKLVGGAGTAVTKVGKAAGKAATAVKGAGGQ